MKTNYYLCTFILYMEDLIFSINVVAPLLVLMAAGYAARRLNFVTDEFMPVVSRFVFSFLLPLMLFQNIRNIFHGNFVDISLIFAATIGVSIVIALSLCVVPLFVKRRGQRGSMIQGIYRSNFVIYGIPLATGMYGQEAAIPCAILLAVMVPYYNITGVIILSAFSETRDNRLSFVNLFCNIARNPLIVGCAAGLLFGALGLDIPAAVNTPIDQLSAAASPLALFLMGGDFKFRRLNNNLWKVFWATAARLVIVPFVAVLALIPMGFRSVELGVLLCVFATPTAVVSYIMASNMGCDGELAGQIVVLTTFASCFTIFLFIFTLKSCGFL